MTTESSVRVALVQVASTESEPVATRVERVVRVIDEVAAGGTAGLEVCAPADLALGRRPDLLVLPELWTVGAFDTAAMLAHAEAIPEGSTVQRLMDLARRHAVWLHAGALAEIHPDGSRSNTSVLLSPTGAVAALYRKIHLFGFDQGEAALLTAGGEHVIVSTPLGEVGLTTCYDLRFPELYRALTVEGAEAFVVPSGWPLSRIEHWRVLLRARAIENQAWVLAANGVGTHAGVTLGGRSAVIDPWGAVVAEAATDKECVMVADLPRDLVASTRASFPVLRDRRM